MKTNLKKVLATLGLVSIVAMNSAYAVQIGTGSIAGSGVSNIESTWNGLADPDTSSASGIVNVQVSAQVAPTLNMNISTGAINFGTLVPGVESTGSLTIGTTTNAEGGVAIAMASNGLQSATKYIGAYGATAPLATAVATDYYKVVSNGAGTDVAAATNVATSQTILSVNNVTASNTTTTVELSALAEATTDAGNYGDTLTFTVTANF